jgi:hypothetical protein
MTFIQKYPNLTWWFTCRYYVLHNSAKMYCITLVLMLPIAHICAFILFIFLMPSVFAWAVV